MCTHLDGLRVGPERGGRLVRGDDLRVGLHSLPGGISSVTRTARSVTNQSVFGLQNNPKVNEKCQPSTLPPCPPPP
jgi:hypothetical protein